MLGQVKAKFAFGSSLARSLRSLATEL